MDTQVKESMWFLNRNNHSGFTLIELIVTTTLGLLLMAGALAAYTSFAARQDKIESARDVRSVIQSARERSRDGNKPETGCTSLNYYRVWGVQGTQNYYMAIRCNNDDDNLEQVTYRLQSGEYFLDDFDLYFGPLPGPVSGTPVTIIIGRLDDSSIRYEFDVTDQGLVEEGSLVTE